MSRGAELVRATYESGWLVREEGIESAYPGYKEATETNGVTNPKVDSLFTRKHEPGMDDLMPATHYEHIIDYSFSNTKVSAIVCQYIVTASPEDHGDGTGGLSMYVTGMTLENTSGQVGKPGVPDLSPGTHDPRAHLPPRWNVFGDWKITRLDTLYPTKKIPIENCLNWIHNKFPELSIIPDPQVGELGVPQNFEPPHYPVAVQYPEWIGPAK